MKSRLIVAAIGVPLLFVVLFFLPSLVLAIVIALVCAVACMELIKAMLPKRSTLVNVSCLLSALVIPIVSNFGAHSEYFAAIAAILSLLVFFDAFLRYSSEQHVSLGDVCKAIFAGFLMPLMLSALVRIKCMEDGRLFVLIPVIITFIGDTGSYFIGGFVGKNKLSPNISPNKTFEGFVGGIVSSIIGVLIYAAILQMAGFTVSYIVFVCYGFLGSLVTQMGDLVYSFIKREAGIKDYSRLLGEHGGFMDRFDALSFSAPFVELLVLFCPAFFR